MRNALHSFIFIFILGGLTAGLITGMDVLTKDRIEANASYEWKAAILEHHGLSVNINTYIETLEEEFFTEGNAENERDLIYRHKELETYSFYFKGGGVWGEINGIITLDADGKTIVKVKVLNQVETPGLGGVVADRKYLDNYVGKKFDPTLDLYITGSVETEVVVNQIAGATNTSRAFINLLNHYYRTVMLAGESPEYRFKKAILNHHGISTSTDTYVNDFNNNFNTVGNDEDEFKNVYRHKTENTYSFYFEGEGFIGHLSGVATIEADGVTILNVSILESEEIQGAAVTTRAYLDQFIGKKFDPILYLAGSLPNLSDDVSIDGIADATTTSKSLVNMLNQAYQNAMGIEDTSDYNFKEAILNHHGITTDLSTYKEDFTNNFNAISDEENEIDRVYKHNTLDTYSYFFMGEGMWGPITGIITLEDDGITILNITILDQSEDRGSSVSTREYLDQYIGKKFDPFLTLAEEIGEVNDDVTVDGIAGATLTSEGLVGALNFYYNAKMGAEEYPLYDFKEAILNHHGETTDEENYLTDFDNLFTAITDEENELDRVYKHKTEGTYSFYFEGVGFIGDIKGVVTVLEDGKTILNVTIIEQEENRGSSVSSREYLDQFIGKVFDPELVLFDAEETYIEDITIDGIAGATITSETLVDSLNLYYNVKLKSLLEEETLTFSFAEAILNHHNLTTTEENFLEDFNANFTAVTNEANKLDRLYKHKTDDTYSFYFEGAGFIGDINGVITIEADEVTILNITILEQEENRGSSVSSREYLDQFINKVFDPELVLFDAEETYIEDITIDGIAGATITSQSLVDMLNLYYNLKMGAE